MRQRDRERLKAGASGSSGRSGSEEGTPRWRLFVALPLPGDVQRHLGAVQSAFPGRASRAVRWLEPTGIHLTLRFLGDTDPQQVSGISAALSEAASQTAKFWVYLGGPGAFPSLRRPRVLWMGVSGETQRLKRLQARVEGALSKMGIKAEHRPFHPHLTVGRIQRETPPPREREAGEAFSKIAVPDPPPAIPVQSVVLYRSHLSREGAWYEALSEAPLS